MELEDIRALITPYGNNDSFGGGIITPIKISLILFMGQHNPSKICLIL